MKVRNANIGKSFPMRSHDLDKRVDELEAEITALRERTMLPPIGIRRRATMTIGKLPLYEISLGSDPGRRQIRGRARGIIAIGGLATGIFSFGGLSVGFLGAFGGLAIGSLAIGGVSAGGVAVGGTAAGYYACGAASAGLYAISTTYSAPEAVTLFRQFGLGGLCDAR